MADNLKFWTVYLLIIGAVLFAGWRQPISYRFKSAAEIYAIEHPPGPATPAPATPWMWNPKRKTMLDREAYNKNDFSGRSGLYNAPR